MTNLFADLNPPPRLLMGPGPVDVDPRVLRAMSVALQGQFDPQFTAYMNETMALYRHVFRTANHWTFLIDGTARAGIEACLVSIVSPGDKMLVPIFGRFGHLKVEIGQRVGGDVTLIEREWGTRVRARRDRDGDQGSTGRACWRSARATPRPPCCSRSRQIGALCRKHDVLLYVDCTASLGGKTFEIDAWQIDIASAGLQKCLSGPPGSSPISFNERVVEVVNARACRAAASSRRGWWKATARSSAPTISISPC